MARLLGEGLDAGAIGVSTSRTERHRTSAGENLGTLRAREPELMALASVLAERGTGVFQLLSDSYRTTDDDFARAEFDLVAAFARASGRPVSYTVQQDIEAPDRWRDLMGLATSLRAEGLDVKAQVAPRPIGVLLGLQASVNVFTPARAYRPIAGLPLAERLAALADPERRRNIIDGHAALTSGPDAFAGYSFFARFDEMYVLDDPVDYDLDASRSLGAIARRAGVDPREYAYDVQLQRDGHQLIYTPMFNFAHGNLDDVHAMITSPVAMFGLSDAGAHCGQICDGSMTTTYLSLWGRDRRDGTGSPSRRWSTRSPSARPPTSAGSTGGWSRPAVWPTSTSSTSTAWSVARPRSPPTCRPAAAASCRRPPATAGRSSGGGSPSRTAGPPANCPAPWCGGPGRGRSEARG